MEIEMKQRCRQGLLKKKKKKKKHAKGFVLNDNYIFPGIPRDFQCKCNIDLKLATILIVTADCTLVLSIKVVDDLQRTML